MNQILSCENCGKRFAYDPADALPVLCADCYYDLGYGEGPRWDEPVMRSLPTDPKILEAYLNAETGDEPPGD